MKMTKLKIRNGQDVIYKGEQGRVVGSNKNGTMNVRLDGITIIVDPKDLTPSNHGKSLARGMFTA